MCVYVPLLEEVYLPEQVSLGPIPRAAQDDSDILPALSLIMEVSLRK